MTTVRRLLQTIITGSSRIMQWSSATAETQRNSCLSTKKVLIRDVISTLVLNLEKCNAPSSNGQMKVILARLQVGVDTEAVGVVVQVAAAEAGEEQEVKP